VSFTFRYKLRFIVPVLLAAAIPQAPAAAEVRVWQGTLTLPTYLEGSADPNPPFDIFASTRFNYPYTMRDNITDKRVDTAWRAVYLENEYLKCSVLPDIGGHLYTCVDKISGQSMFYANPSIKKARIGYRGAWAAFGVEFNFPVSHNWVSMSPVDFSFRRNPDGSGSVFVGNIDRPYGMQWTVELRLRPATAVLEQHVTLYNRSDVRHRFYWWNNAGVRVWDDSRICYPQRWSASHGFADVDTWPVDSSGKDLSLISNQTRGTVSRFTHGSREPFMGVYHPHTNTGVAHYADYGDLPAKKVWSWGVDADGLDWRRALSDDNSGYVEVQAGLMRNQETYAFLEPRQTIAFTEYWMPVRGTGGIARANLAGVFNLRREGGKAVAVLNANAAVTGAKIRIGRESQTLYETTADLAPERTWSHEIAGAPDAPLTFEVRDAAGRILLAQTEGQYDWSPEPEIKVGPQPRQSPAGPLETGADRELNGRALKQTPDDFSLRVAAGRLAVSLLRYADAVRWLEPAQAKATYDPEIAYYLGIAYQGLGRDRNARAQFEAAHRMPEFRAAAGLKLAELLARQGDLARASAYLENAAASDQRAREERIALGRAMKHPVAGPGPEFSLFLSENTGSDPERVLMIAGEYMRLGLWREALDRLSRKYPAVPSDEMEPGIPAVDKHPMVAYYRAFCREKLGESAAADYDLASKLPAAYVFPNGAESLEVLEAATRSHPNDASAHFLLASMRMASGLVDDAIAEWKTARRLNPAIPVLDASLGRALLYLKHDVEGALEAYRAGLSSDPKNDEIYRGLQVSLVIANRPPAEAAAVLERYPDPKNMPAPLAYELALDHAEAAQFDRAKAQFAGRFFAREEGGTNVRQVWIRIRAMEARWKAGHGQCSEAVAIADHLTEPVAGLDFTRDGLDVFAASPAVQVDLGFVDLACGRREAAGRRLDALARAGDPASIAFGYALARELNGPGSGEWLKRVEAAYGRAGRRSEAGGGPSGAIAGVLAADLGKTEEARGLLVSALLGPDRNLVHHYAREALRKLPGSGAAKP
jgi:tetratricopeptide (TPR) repeat protein